MSDKPTLLVIDDEKNIREGLRAGLKMEGFDVVTAEDGEEGLSKCKTILPDAVILDLRMPKLGGLEFLKHSTASFPEIPVIVLTGHGDLDDAVESMRRGAYDFLSKPINIEKLVLVIQRAIQETARKTRQEQLEEMVEDKYRFDNIIGNSKAFHRVLQVVRQVAPTDATVLITGESGTGKEVIANALHTNSRRSKGPFIKVHCAALPETLLESELFGHEKGAFTGAMARKRGRFELADGGTIFLDEIGEISPSVQVKLLRVLQEQEFERLGGEETLKVNLRIIAATNKDLQKQVKEGLFREDLFYRLNIVNLHLPPLRERPEDIPLFVKEFIEKFSQKHGKKIRSIEPKALKLLESHRWPGNVRELQNLIEKLVVLSDGETITEAMIPFSGGGENRRKLEIDIGTSLDEIEKQAILATLDSTSGNKSRASRILGIGRKTLLRKLEEYGMKSDDSEED